MHGAHLRELAHDVDEVAVLELLARRGHELHERLAGVAALANDEMPQIPGAVGLRVRLEPFLARPVAHRVAKVVAEVGREPALLEVEHLVPAAGPVQAERGAVGRLRERVLHLVAVVEDLGLARDDLLERRLGDARDALERVAHLRLLLRELRAVLEILEAAAAALGEVRARRLDALRPRPHDLGGERLCVRALHLRHARAHAIARQAAAHEDDEPVEARDAVAAVRERLDVELELLILRHRRGHRGTVTTKTSDAAARGSGAAAAGRN